MAERHILTPLKMWQKVQQGLLAVAMHEDDVEFCELGNGGGGDDDDDSGDNFGFVEIFWSVVAAVVLIGVVNLSVAALFWWQGSKLV